MTRKLGVGLAIVEKLLERDVSPEGGKEILRSNTVSGFIEHDRQVFFRLFKETQKECQFGYGIIRTASVSAYTTSRARRGEVDDGIPEEVDVG